MNKLPYVLTIAMLLAGISLPLKAQETSKVPHSMLAAYLKAGNSVTTDGVEYTPLYLKFKEGVIFKSEEAQFRIQKENKAETPVKCDILSAIPKDKLTKFDVKQIEDGSTHRIWVRKDVKDDGASILVWNLPKGSVSISVYNEVPFKKQLFPK
ncbi:MAG: hypothetical protein AB8D78_06230 [Akkermansiaceae bacterium]